MLGREPIDVDSEGIEDVGNVALLKRRGFDCADLEDNIPEGRCDRDNQFAFELGGLGVEMEVDVVEELGADAYLYGRITDAGMVIDQPVVVAA